MLWSHGNIRAEIFTLDHCDPHVTFVCKPDRWTAKMEFSMVSPTFVNLVSIKPLINAPSTALINALAAEVLSHLQLCRATWWKNHGSVCLDNKPVTQLAQSTVQLGSAGSGRLGRIVAGSGKYLGASDAVEALIQWGDGSRSLATVGP